MSAKRLAVCVGVLVMLSAARAAADPAPADWTRLRSASEVRTEAGSHVTLPPGYFLPEPAFERLDAELRRLQDAETRLKAENESLRASAAWSGPGWGTVALVLGAAGAGIAAGAHWF